MAFLTQVKISGRLNLINPTVASPAQDQHFRFVSLAIAVLTFLVFFVWTKPTFAATQNTQSDNPQVRVIEQADLVYMTLDTGLVVIELAPFMAPNYVKQFKALVKDGYYNGLDFYRVIDGFVAQAGDQADSKKSKWDTPAKDEPTRKVTDFSNFYSAQNPALLADETGYINGFPAGRDNQDKQEWLLHCYGVVALARQVELNTGSTDFYINIGHAPRSLDRNMTVFGRVVYGMDNVQKIQRPEFGAGGVIEDANKRTKIVSAELGSNKPAKEQIHLVQDTVYSDAFQQRLEDGRTKSNDFFVYKGNGNIDACYYQPRIKLASDQE